MNSGQSQWPAVQDNAPSMAAAIPVGVGIVRRHPVMLAALFASIALLGVLIGAFIPKKYTASTSILVEQSNIIGPLMEGRAVPTGVANRAAMAREVAFSRRVMNDILKTGGWLASHPNPVEQEQLIEQIKDRTSISTPMPTIIGKNEPPTGNLIQISYYDSDPKRAFIVTRRLGELIIEESLATKERESRQAYEFIKAQTEQYRQKLAQAEARLEDYRISHPDARAGVTTDVTSRIGELRRLVDGARMDMIDSASEEGALRSQLSGESEVSSILTHGGQIRARLAELQGERERLLLTYTEQYPDVVRVTHQIRDLEEDLARANAGQAAKSAGSAASLASLDGSVSMNPLYTELRSRMATAHQRRAASSSRLATGQSLLNEEMQRSTRIAQSERVLSALTRDYEVNRDLYQDLLKRRENARVSMNLDAEREGLSFSIQEPAVMPLRPSGLRMMHVALAGLVLALLAPLLLVAGYIKVDPRVRTPLQIERNAGLPVLGTIPRYSTRPQRVRGARRVAVASLMVLSVPIVFGLILAIKLANPS
jgi:polysaccharide chain length determinant protein (PEP-CTERM system associated)